VSVSKEGFSTFMQVSFSPKNTCTFLGFGEKGDTHDYTYFCNGVYEIGRTDKVKLDSGK
jgi:hypothetical protein